MYCINPLKGKRKNAGPIGKDTAIIPNQSMGIKPIETEITGTIAKAAIFVCPARP